MNQRFLMWGLASITFVVTAAVNSWHDGLWQSEETLPAPAHGVRTASFEVADETTNVPSRPFAPTHAAPPAPAPAPVTVAAVTPPPPASTVQEEAAPPPVEPSTQPSAQELDEADFQAHSDRAAERSARSH